MNHTELDPAALILMYPPHHMAITVILVAPSLCTYAAAESLSLLMSQTSTSIAHRLIRLDGGIVGVIA